VRGGGHDARCSEGLESIGDALIIDGHDDLADALALLDLIDHVLHERSAGL
jgi:hypothetical protein